MMQWAFFVSKLLVCVASGVVCRQAPNWLAALLITVEIDYYARVKVLHV